ncbi:hypothetical protein MNBD_GAMMA04-312, partial [hydrothermal vent metagenome]
YAVGKEIVKSLNEYTIRQELKEKFSQNEHIA